MNILVTEQHFKLHKDFALPIACKRLYDLGVRYKTIYTWEVVNNLAELKTNEFDYDDYYVAANRFLKAANNSISYPAFNINLLESFFEKLAIEKNGKGKYKLIVDEKYGYNCFTGDHLPTMLAYIVHKIIMDGQMTVNEVNHQLKLGNG